MPDITDEEIEAMAQRLKDEPNFINSLEFGKWLKEHKSAVMEWAQRTGKSYEHKTKW